MERPPDAAGATAAVVRGREVDEGAGESRAGQVGLNDCRAARRQSESAVSTWRGRLTGGMDIRPGALTTPIWGKRFYRPLLICPAMAPPCVGPVASTAGDSWRDALQSHTGVPGDARPRSAYRTPHGTAVSRT
jgi:hypothetical protein